MSVPTRVRTAAGLALLLALVSGIGAGWGSPAWWGPVLLTAGVTLGELRTVSLGFGRQRWALSLTEATIAGALVFAPGAWIVLPVAAGELIALVARRRPRLKVEFNVAQFAACASVAALVSALLGNGIVGPAVGMVAFWVVNYGLVSTAITVSSEQRLWDVLRQAGPLSGLHSIGNAAVGMLAAWLTVNAPAGLAGLVVPLALLWFSYDQQTKQDFETKLFAELAAGHERVSGRSTDVSARIVLSAAARLFGGDAELVLLAGESPERYFGDEKAVTRELVDGDALGEPWVVRVFGARGVVCGTEDNRPYCSALLGDADRPLAALITRRPAGGVPFDRRDQVLAGVMVRQAESWLSVAELTASRDEALTKAAEAGEVARALGDLGADTWPTLVTLRESASRLARLASLPDGPDPVGEIVDELHAAERAVASLLGAIAIAADPELRGLTADGEQADEAIRLPAAEWTTTGVLADEVDVR